MGFRGDPGHVRTGLSGNLINDLLCVFRIRVNFKAEPVLPGMFLASPDACVALLLRTLLVDGVLVGSGAGVNRGLVGIDGGTDGLTELMRFT